MSPLLPHHEIECQLLELVVLFPSTELKTFYQQECKQKFHHIARKYSKQLQHHHHIKTENNNNNNNKENNNNPSTTTAAVDVNNNNDNNDLIHAAGLLSPSKLKKRKLQEWSQQQQQQQNKSSSSTSTLNMGKDHHHNNHHSSDFSNKTEKTVSSYQPSHRALLATQKISQTVPGHLIPSISLKKAQLTCSVCKEVAAPPYAGVCGHIACKTCWLKLFKDKSSCHCPYCRRDVLKMQLKRIEIVA